MQCFKRKITLKRAVHDLRNIQHLLDEMIVKYERLRDETTRQLHAAKGKSTKIRHLRRVKTLQAHITNCYAKHTACSNKLLALEQLEITKKQIETLKDATSVFASYFSPATVEKIDQMQEKMQDQLDHLSDVNDMLASPSFDFDDDDLEAELTQLTEESIQEEVEEILPPVPVDIPARVQNKQKPDSNTSPKLSVIM